MVKDENFNADAYLENFAQRFYQTLGRITKQAQAYYNPIYANDLMQDINSTPHRPTQANLRKWLENPKEYEKELRDVSQFLSYNIMQYKRAIGHFASLLSLNYELIPLDRYPKTPRTEKEYINAKKKANEWLRKFRPKEQFENVLYRIMTDGASYYYLRESDEYIDLQEMPQDFCIINGRTSLGYTYAFDMTYFARYPESFRTYAPELYIWFKDVLDDYKETTLKTIYNAMPPEKSACFKLEDWTAVSLPPMTGTFKDALEIQDYKDLLKLKLELDTWKVIMMEIPKDSDGIPTIDAGLAADFTAIVQAQVANGVRVASTPMKPIPVDFNQSQTQNNIIGTGEANFWNSAGVYPGQYGGDTTSGNAVKYANIADYNFVRQMYRQFERFINFHLTTVTGKYRFAVKFFGCRFFEQEERADTLAYVQSGGHPERLFASYGYEPYEIESMLEGSYHSGIRDLMIPLQTAHTMSGNENGRPQKPDTQKTDAGINSDNYN